MAGADAFLVCPHKERHRIEDVAVYCPSCRRLVLVRTEPSDRTVRDLQIMVLTVATLGAGVLFRLTNQVWPAYLYLGLALTFLYAVVFSRGRGTLSAAGGALGLVTLGWLGWWLIGRHVHLSGTVSALTHALPAAVLLLSLVTVLLMRHWALPVAREPGTYLLAAGVFTLGFWGVWATLLQGGLVSPVVYQIAVASAFIAPLAFIPLIRKWRPYQDNQGSLIIWGAIVVAYLMVADLVVRALGYVLGQLFPHILGLTPLTPVRVRIGYPDVRAALTVSALGIILLVALTDSIVVVWQRFKEPDPVDPVDPKANPTSGQHVSVKTSVEQVVGDAADRAVLIKSRADLSCTLGGDRGVVSYHLFATNEEMNRVYATALNGRGLAPNAGSCGPADRVTATYSHGRVGCYTNGGTAWTVWTDDRFNVLSLYRRSNGDLTVLYEYWRTGALGPATPVQ